MSEINMTKPMLWNISKDFWLSGLPLIISIKLNNKCPPSKSGIGNKLINPKFKDIKTINHNVLWIPFCQKSPDSSAIRIGPPNSSAPLVPVIISYTPIIVNFTDKNFNNEELYFHANKNYGFERLVNDIKGIYLNLINDSKK